MKLVRFLYNGDERVGALLDGEVVDVQAAYACYLFEEEGDAQAQRVAPVRVPPDLLSLLRAGDVSLDACRRGLNFVEQTGRSRGIRGKRLRYDPGEVELLLPVRPETALFAGPNADPRYAERLAPHLEVYYKSQHAFIGPGEAILYRPETSSRLGAAVELGVIIGKPGRYLTPEEVAGHILGYTVLLNVTARDHLQVGWEGSMWHMRYGEGASFDTSAAMGPAIVTADEVGSLSELILSAERNGEPLMRYGLGELRHSVEEFVSYCSTFFTLEPGILLSPGSPGGSYLTVDERGNPVMVEREEETRYLEPGDRLVGTVTGLGTLTVEVKADEPGRAGAAGKEAV